MKATMNLKNLRSLRNLRNLKSLISLISLTSLILFFGACSQDEDTPATGDGRLTLSAQTGDPQTRATSGNTWDGGETVTVNVNGNDYPFAAATDGTLTSATLYWKDYASIDAFAYYPATYAYAADQSAGFQAADFIFAEQVTGITQSTYNTTKKLTFRHKTAKVTATLTAGAGITNITGATVTFYGYTAVAAIDNTGTNPTGAITGKTLGWITPDGANTALLIPKSYANENVLKVTLEGKDYFWQPASLNLEAGKSYTFAITVENNALTVTVTDNGATWGAGSTDEVTAVRTHIRDIPVAYIPKGTFMMGSPTSEPDRRSNETQHQVTLTKDFI
ncbi:hypothetical protein FACS1894203_4860 [Bacteroidia bacterium]|nr:hypothetical protein FACS1894203_4860 [Bacteroidia bacterium]GHU91002.1 hypothetical protein FACS1894155_10100 [Bacteroidia bacterium]